MKLKHNKKRNTAFLYEVLIRHLTKSVLDQDADKKNKVLEMIREHFKAGTLLNRELEAYNAVLSERRYDYYTAERMICEAKRTVIALDQEQLFQEQSDLIKAINKNLSRDAYSIFIPNYKDLASIHQIFSDKVPVKTRVLLEGKLAKKLSTRPVLTEDNMPTVDNIVYKTFVKKFNQQYGESLLQEQKQLLSAYIGSFADNGLGLKLFLNEEVARLHSRLVEVLNGEDTNLDESVVEKIDKVINVIEDFRTKEVNQEMVEKVLRIQSLVEEI
jgi:hypothetical protein